MMLLLEQTWLCPGTLESGAHVTDNAVECGCGNRNLQNLAKILDRKPCASPIVPYVELVSAYVDNYRDKPGLEMNPESWD